MQKSLGRPYDAKHIHIRIALKKLYNINRRHSLGCTSQNPRVTCEGSINLTKLGVSAARYAWTSSASSMAEDLTSARLYKLSMIAFFGLLLQVKHGFSIFTSDLSSFILNLIK